MKIIIVGAGKVGATLCSELAEEGHDVLLIEKSNKALEKIIEKSDITGYCGNGALHETQIEAGVGSCDIFIAVTPQDETNILSAVTATANGAAITIARVRDPDYTEQINFLTTRLGIRRVINPELQAAREIAQMLQFPEAAHVDQFAGGRVYLLELPVPNHSSVIGMSIRQLRQRFSDLIVCIISHEDGSVSIPSGDTIIRAHDHIHVTGRVEDLDHFYHFLGVSKRKIKHALIIGGGRISRHLIPRLLRANIRAQVIEKDEETAHRLAALFPQTEVTVGDGTDQDFLLEYKIQNYDAVISLTGIDEENLLVSLFAERLRVRKIVSKINRLNLLDLMPRDSQLSVVTPAQLVAEQIIRLVRAQANSQGSNVDGLYRLAEGKVEAVQFKVHAESKLCNRQLSELPLQNQTLIAYIQRNTQLIFPTGTDQVFAGDRVVVFTAQQSLVDLDDILQSEN